VAYTVVCSPPLNLAAAQAASRTIALSEVRPWENNLTVLDVVEGVALRAVKREGSIIYTMDIFHESSAARCLKERMRLVSGYVPGSSEPACVTAERERRVPEFLLGLSVLQMPKVLRRLFLLDLPSPVLEADLVASHLKAFVEVAERESIPCAELLAYVQNKTTVAEFRTKIAGQMGVSVKDVKVLMTSLGYGSSGSDWQSKHGVAAFPPEVAAMQATFRAIIPCLWSKASTELKKVCEARARPQLTCASSVRRSTSASHSMRSRRPCAATTSLCTGGFSTPLSSQPQAG
jgi:hypothetical protein